MGLRGHTCVVLELVHRPLDNDAGGYVAEMGSSIEDENVHIANEIWEDRLNFSSICIWSIELEYLKTLLASLLVSLIIEAVFHRFTAGHTKRAVICLDKGKFA